MMEPAGSVTGVFRRLPLGFFKTVLKRILPLPFFSFSLSLFLSFSLSSSSSPFLLAGFLLPGTSLLLCIAALCCCSVSLLWPGW